MPVAVTVPVRVKYPRDSGRSARYPRSAINFTYLAFVCANVALMVIHASVLDPDFSLTSVLVDLSSDIYALLNPLGFRYHEKPVRAYNPPRS